MANSGKITERGSDGIAFEAATPASQPGDVFPAGTVLDYAGGAAPTNWAICDGSAVSRASNPGLLALLNAGGSALGAGDGSTTLTLPDCRGKVNVAKHSAGTFATMGATGGEETHLITAAETGIRDHNHSYSGNTGTESADHTHTTTAQAVLDGTGGGSNQWGTAGSHVAPANLATGGRSAAHTHAYSGVTSSTGNSNATNAHNNLQPYVVLNRIIKLG